MDLKNEVKYFSGLIADKAEEGLDAISNEVEYRTKRVTDFWGIPKVDFSGLNKAAGMIVDPQQRPSIQGQKPMLPSEMVEDAAAPTIAKAINWVTDKTGLDPRLGLPILGVATSMRPASWSKGVKSLNNDPQAIQKYLSKPYHKSMQGTRFEHMTLEDLSNNKGGWLDTLSDRDTQFSSAHTEYMKKPSAEKQRAMYDDFTDNPLSNSKQVYDPNNPIRKAITKTFNQVTGKEWHHVFGNKEAAETMLTTIAQDPYVAVNLFHHMQKLNLPVSGKADNIALMGKKSHRLKDSLHSYQKKLGLENAGRKKGDLELNDYAAAISEAVLKGETDVTELFTLIEKYAQLNKEHLRPKIKNEFGGKMLNELKGVEAFIQGQ